MYPSTSKYARRGVGAGTGNRPLPADPTDAEPGSAEKIAVLAARAKAGVSLHHAADRTLPRQTDRPAGLFIWDRLPSLLVVAHRGRQRNSLRRAYGRRRVA